MAMAAAQFAYMTGAAYLFAFVANRAVTAWF